MQPGPTITITETPLDHVTPAQLQTRQQGPLVAVDLGTTAIRLAVMENGRPVPLLAPRQRPAPAVIAVAARGNVVVGLAAEQQAASRPDLAVRDIKRLVGGTFNSDAVRAVRERQACRFFQGPNGQVGVQLADRTFSPREMVAILLADARSRAQELLRQQVFRMVVAIPAGRDAWFNDMVYGGAAIAGLHLAAAVPEPLAAAFSGARSGKGKDKVVGVYDWGGGGFTFSVIRPAEGRAEVASTGVDASIGGGEIDAALLRWVLSAMPADHPLHGDEAAAKNPRLLAAAERMKIELSQAPQARARVPFVADGNVDFEAEVKREELDQVLEPFVTRSLALAEDTLINVGMFPGDVEELLLVGDQSRAPMVRERLAQFFPGVPLRADSPGDAIVLGACGIASSRAQARPPTR